MANQGIVEIGAHGGDYRNRRGSRCIQQQAIDIGKTEMPYDAGKGDG